MVQPIRRPGLISIGAKVPTAIRNCNAELRFDIPLTVQRSESKILTASQIQERAGRSYQRRCLVKITVVRAKDPIQPRNSHRHAKTGINGVLRDGSVELRYSQTGDQSQPWRDFELVVDEFGGNASVCSNRRCGEVLTAVGKYIIEIIVLVLKESVDAGLQIIFPEVCVYGCLHARIVSS